MPDPQEPRTGGVAGSVHDYRCSGDCYGCGGGGLPGAVCGLCGNSGVCQGCGHHPSPESLGITPDHDGWFTEYLVAVKDAS